MLLLVISTVQCNKNHVLTDMGIILQLFV